MISTGSEPSIVKTLADLAELRASGVVTDGEFEAKKAELLERI